MRVIEFLRRLSDGSSAGLRIFSRGADAGQRRMEVADGALGALDESGEAAAEGGQRANPRERIRVRKRLHGWEERG